MQNCLCCASDVYVLATAHHNRYEEQMDNEDAAAGSLRIAQAVT